MKREKTSTMPKPKRGEVWLVRFPFSDLTSAKLRPALALVVHGEDVIVMGIFSRVLAGTLRRTWVRIEDSHPAFARISSSGPDPNSFFIGRW